VTSKLDSYQHRLQHAELKIQVLEERRKRQSNPPIFRA
jgi:hypothetical protein